MTIQMHLCMSELNDIYYALGKVLEDSNATYNRDKIERLQLAVWKKIEQLDIDIQKQIEQDEIYRDLNFKHNFVREGDY